MVIGKPVPESENQYHVRDTNKDLVYVVNLNPENLSTSFKDWIEGDLLKLNPLDLQEVDIHDYSVELRPVLTANGFVTQVGWDRRGEFLLEYDKAESKWNPKRLQKFEDGKKELVEFEIAEDEELNTEALQAMRSSLEDLLIVDVERKPAGLSGNLQAGESFLNNQDAVDSLSEKGFAAVPLKPGAEPEILSSEGQLVCTMNDGVEYLLRFGNLKADSQETGNAETKDGATESAAAGNDIYRYLFVMARFNELMIASPELEGFPELPEGITEEEVKAAQEAADAATKAAEEAAKKDDSPESTEEDNPAEVSEKVEEEEEEEEADAEETAELESTDAATEASAEETTEEAEEPEDLISPILAIRAGIQQENERRQNEYEEKIAASKQRVQELNERFGDWYYVIDNEVYKKLHLGRDQIIKKKDKEGESTPGATPPAGIPGLPNLPADGAP